MEIESGDSLCFRVYFFYQLWKINVSKWLIMNNQEYGYQNQAYVDVRVSTL